MPTIQRVNQPVTQITVIEVDAGKQDEALAVMAERAQFMSRAASSIISNGRTAICCDRLTNLKTFENSGVNSTS
jgi:acyl CoA:acetate/3-ketoacid CoA transferase alpha subunit